MKRMIALLLACMVLLSACGMTSSHRRDWDDEDEDEGGLRLPGFGGAETAVETRAPVRYGTVTFEKLYDDGYEFAVLTCTDDSGMQLWQVKTDRYQMAQLSRVSDIGQFEDRYYFVDDGAVVALGMADGTELWRNGEFGGCPTTDCAVIGETGTVYLSGFFGPDLFVVDANGKTLLREGQVDSSLYWPCRLEIDWGMNQAVIYMSGGPQGDVGSENAVPVYVNLP